MIRDWRGYNCNVRQCNHRKSLLCKAAVFGKSVGVELSPYSRNTKGTRLIWLRSRNIAEKVWNCGTEEWISSEWFDMVMMGESTEFAALLLWVRSCMMENLLFSTSLHRRLWTLEGWEVTFTQLQPRYGVKRQGEGDSTRWKQHNWKGLNCWQ